LITLDSSALIAVFDKRDQNHSAVMSIVEGETGEFIVPAAILSEIAYFVEKKLGQRTLGNLVRDIISGTLTLDCTEQGWPRVLELAERYHDLPLGLADAAVIECAERHGGRVLTLNRRHFGAVQREGLIRVLP